jgi:hypothetical protein
MNRYWFKPKIFGYGATPVTWEGWLLATGYLVFVLFMTLGLLGREPSVVLWVLWVVVIVAVTAAMTWLARLKTEGEWRWRWGRTNTGRMS